MDKIFVAWIVVSKGVALAVKYLMVKNKQLFKFQFPLSFMAKCIRDTSNFNFSSNGGGK